MAARGERRVSRGRKWPAAGALRQQRADLLGRCAGTNERRLLPRLARHLPGRLQDRPGPTARRASAGADVLSSARRLVRLGLRGPWPGRGCPADYFALPIHALNRGHASGVWTLQTLTIRSHHVPLIMRVCIAENHGKIRLVTSAATTS